jgi:hypothetical protein
MEMQMTGAMGRGRSSGVGVAIRCISGEDESFGRSLFFVVKKVYMHGVCTFRERIGRRRIGVKKKAAAAHHTTD